MGTEKRERQKANRQLKYEQQAKEQQRRKLTRRVVIGIAAVVAALAFVLFLAWAFGSDDEDDAPPATTTVATETTAATETTTAGSTTTVTPQPFAYGTGACPPEQVAEPVRQFDDAPELCIDPAASYTARFVTSLGDIVSTSPRPTCRARSTTSSRSPAMATTTTR